MEMSFYDRHGTGQLTHALIEGVQSVRDGIGDKLAVSFWATAEEGDDDLNTGLGHF